MDPREIPLHERRLVHAKILKLARNLPLWSITLEAEGHETTIVRELTYEEAGQRMWRDAREGWKVTLSIEMTRLGLMESREEDSQ